MCVRESAESDMVQPCKDLLETNPANIAVCHIIQCLATHKSSVFSSGYDLRLHVSTLQLWPLSFSSPFLVRIGLVKSGFFAAEVGEYFIRRFNQSFRKCSPDPGHRFSKCISDWRHRTRHGAGVNDSVTGHGCPQLLKLKLCVYGTVYVILPACRPHV